MDIINVLILSEDDYYDQFQELPEDYIVHRTPNRIDSFEEGIPDKCLPGWNADAKKRLADKG